MNAITPVSTTIQPVRERPQVAAAPAQEPPRFRRLASVRPGDVHAVLTYSANAGLLRGQRTARIDIHV
ncbi:MAG: hypothetical protein H6993_02585 [Pseudomonadales bacterium]|nr:hypothetical protein [Pseudomonadales bacterium]MCP5182816.1 hypothetical protein [Pseudomonadales bacterium]